MKNSNRIRPMKLLVSSALLILILVSGCQGPFDLATALGLDLDTLTISPNDIVVDKDSQVTFVASPTGVYQWSVVSGSGGINSTSGVYTPSGDIEYVTVQATDPETGQFGQSTLRFDAGVDIHILVQSNTLFPGDTSVLYAYGGNGGAYTYALDIDNTGADVTGDIYTAGPIPGTDTVSVTDGTNIITTTIAVLDPATSLPDIDYSFPGNVTVSVPATLGELAVDGGSFTYQNSGGASGGVNVDWAAYISTTQGLGGIVSQVDSGTAGPLSAGGSSVIDFDITWPNESGIYYVVVQLFTATDVNTGNNIGWTGSAETLTVSYSAAVPAGGTYVPGGASILTYNIVNTGSVTGYAPVNWCAYISADNTLGAGDAQVSSGSVPANLFSPDQDILPTVDWPVSGDVYVIVQYESADDPASPKEAVSAVFTPPDVDFRPELGSEPPGGTVSFGTNPGHTFTIGNFGADTSTGDIDWVAWLSPVPDMIPGDVGDIQLAAGTIINPLLDNGDTVSTDLGVWNAPIGDYNLIVTWTSSEDTAPGNNIVESDTPYSIVQVDYEIDSSSLSFASAGKSGALLNATTEFSIKETNGVDGLFDVNYSVYASFDMTLDAGDTKITPAIDPTIAISANENELIPLDGVYSWPSFGSEYYLIINIDAVDDADDSNNQAVMGPISVPTEALDENVNGNDTPGPYSSDPPIPQTTNLDDYIGDLDMFELVTISGTTGDPGDYDVYRFVPAAGTTEIYIRLDWTTDVDYMDLYMWTATPPDYEWWAGSFDPKYEIMVVDDLVEGQSYYIGLHMFNPIVADESYILTIQGLP